MANRRKPKKIVKYRRGIRINSGILIFGAIFIYMIITIVLYLTSSHVTAYEVRNGSLVKDHTYMGLILRQEKIFNADQAGYVNYYAREGEKVGVQTPVYTIDESGQASDTATEDNGENRELDSTDLAQLQLLIENFSDHFDPSSFHDTYDFKYDTESRLLEMVSENLTSGGKDENASGLNIKKAGQDGVIAYSVDGMESLKPASITPAQMNSAKYDKNDLRSNKIVKQGDPVYKLITSETWNIMIELDKDTADKLRKEDTVELRFLKDDSTGKAGFELMEKDGKTYGKLTMHNSLIRFATERYTELELILNNKSGLKIPKSALVEQDFYVIPKEYLTKGGNKNSVGFLKETAGKGGVAATQFITVDLYEETDKEVYVNKSDFLKGDALIKPDSTDRYIIGDTKSLQGVFNVNKGYAVFKKIDLVAENDEYCIVKEGTEFGLAQYDHIALDGKSVTEEDFIH